MVKIVITKNAYPTVTAIESLKVSDDLKLFGYLFQIHKIKTEEIQSPHILKSSLTHIKRILERREGEVELRLNEEFPIRELLHSFSTYIPEGEVSLFRQV